jgi:hypothetical protein
MVVLNLWTLRLRRARGWWRKSIIDVMSLGRASVAMVGEGLVLKEKRIERRWIWLRVWRSVSKIGFRRQRRKVVEVWMRMCGFRQSVAVPM